MATQQQRKGKRAATVKGVSTTSPPTSRATTPVPKTPKTGKKQLFATSQSTGRVKWIALDSSGPLCDCLERAQSEEQWRKQFKEDHPLFEQVLKMVALEKLSAGLVRDATVFWKSEGRKEAKRGLDETHGADTESMLAFYADKVIQAVRSSAAIDIEVNNWLLRQDFLNSEEQQREETTDERFNRLQEFWGQFHESPARQPISRSAPVRSVPSRPTTPAARPSSHHSRRGTTIEERKGSKESVESDEESAMAADCRDNIGPKLWETQGYFPKIQYKGGTISGQSSLQITNSMKGESGWKTRGGRSRCHFGRWNWSQDQSATLKPSSSGNLSRTVSTSASATWTQRAERAALANTAVHTEPKEWQSLYQRMSDPKELGLSSFMTPKHLKQKSCSLPDLVRSGIGQGSTSGRGPAPSSRSRQLQKSSSALAGTGDAIVNGMADAKGAPNSFTLPWRAANAAMMKAHATPTGKYLQVCSDNGVVPALIPFTTGHSTKLVAAGKDLVDSDLQAMMAMVRGIRVETVDLGGCVLLTEKALAQLTQTLIGMPASYFLKHLSLRRCVGVGTTTLETIVTLLSDPDEGAQKLLHLDLSGVHIGVKAQLPMCKAIQAHPSLQTLRLEETRLGEAIDAKQCVCLVASSGTIRNLDLGWNCFDADVFKSLGDQIVESYALRSLSLANCSAALEEDEMPGSFFRQRLREECTPIVYFVETLARCKTLTRLDLSVNRIDFRGALVIEDALDGNNVLKELDMSYNPLGPLGMRSLLRLLTRDSSGLMNFKCTGSCQGRVEPTEKDIVFSATNPSGRYKLDLSRPEDRAMLRMLYKSCERFRLSPDAAFADMSYSEKGYQHPQKDELGFYDVPNLGIFKTTFNVEKMKEGAFKDVGEGDFQYFLHRVLKSARYAPGFRKVVPLMALWRRMTGHFAEQKAMLEALSKDFLLTYSQVKQLCNTREVTAHVFSHLIGCIQGGAGARHLGFLLVPSPADLVRVLSATHNFVSFNAENPTGHYCLDLENFADHACAEQLLLLDRWEAGIASRLQLVDVSQKGNRSYFRNEKFQGRPMKVNSVAEWHLPESDVFEFDYSSGQRPPADAVVLDDKTVDSMIAQLAESECSALDRVNALRSVAHRIYLGCEQVRKLIDVLRDSAARIELMVAVFFRIVDVQNEKQFRVRYESKQDFFEIQRRLGCASFFPFIQPEQTEFEFNFEFHDNRLAANAMLLLAGKEGGQKCQNVKEYSFTKENGEVDPLTMGVPRGWEYLEKIPKAGIFRLRYTCAPEDRKLQSRIANLQQFGRHQREVEEHSIKWWASLSGVPDDLIEYLMFCAKQKKFTSFDDLFVEIDGPGGNGDISFDEFSSSIKRMKCTVFKGKDEIDRLRNIFRYLDPGGEGTLSIGEWGILDQIWLEIRMTIENFVQFIDRMFEEDMEKAWDVLLEHAGEPGDSVSYENWSRACLAVGYFGPVKPIFTFLDRDRNGCISWKEYEVLFDIKDGKWQVAIA